MFTVIKYKVVKLIIENKKEEEERIKTNFYFYVILIRGKILSNTIYN